MCCPFLRLCRHGLVYGSLVHGRAGTASHQPWFPAGTLLSDLWSRQLGITLLFQGSHYGYWHVFFSIILLCSLLEYAVSALMERVFHTRWWDYHDMKFNIHGRICLETMLPFGLLGTFALYRINPFLMMLFHRIPGYVSGKLVTGVVVLFLADLVISVCVLRNLSLPDGDADHTAEISRRVWEDLKKRLG